MNKGRKNVFFFWLYIRFGAHLAQVEGVIHPSIPLVVAISDGKRDTKERGHRLNEE